MTKKILIGIATYNECDNIKDLVEQIINIGRKNIDILIVDDNSPDGTIEEIKKLQKKFNNIFLVVRIGKLGLGSAHKRIIHFAKINKYDGLLTMDADFSHPPNLIKEFIKKNDEKSFIIGSRYTKGGSCDYVGYRKYISIFGNYVARSLLRIPSYEVTTSYRFFPKIILNSLNLTQIRSDGYAFFVEIINFINLKSFKIIEIPMHFIDRKNNISKIPGFQIFFSGLRLVQFFFKSIKSYQEPSLDFSQCRGCKSQDLIEYKNFNNYNKKYSSIDFSCSSVSKTNVKPDLHKCIDCDLVQVSPSNSIKNLDEMYEDVVDIDYINNLNIKYKTFNSVFKKIKPYLEKSQQKHSKINILEIGSYYGVLLNILEKNKLNAIGIEPSKHAFEYSKNHNNQKNINVSFDKFIKDCNAINFNLVMAFDVIEHVEDVDKFIQQVGKLMREDNFFIFSTIFIDSWFAKMLGNNWPWIIPMHLSYFNKKNINYFLKKHNFEIVSISNHIHHAKINYAIKGLLNKFPYYIKFISKLISFVVPNKLSIPFSLPDTKIIVARKFKKE
ncbi:MAG: glycosyltransferase [Pelagibacteraceae bacterium]|jgi:dolichol-phosphate mannosyltransferase|nr:glycosyltransferase [Pelagibacteraceae bacterium]MBO6471373.1 glycosyltransferase [Pelagibacteraceae bacterium]MBO6472335.1 glycosyltransferase [Pelagibacteraceae bacterium]|tara:strand:- start:425 stop:2086 length:1662 start_codon:yes stop_codon:yes gene_type:complete